MNAHLTQNHTFYFAIDQSFRTDNRASNRLFILFVIILSHLTNESRSFSLLPKQPVGLSREKIAQLARKRFYRENNTNVETPMKEKVVVITGASGGIASQLCKVMYSLGATVIALDRNTIGLNQLQKQLTNDKVNENSRIITFTTHHEDLNSVRNVANEIMSKYPKIDVLVNNAGLSYSRDDTIPGSPSTISAHGNDLAFTVNYLSHFLLTTKLLPNLSKAKGRIVHVTSTYHWQVSGSELLPSLGDPIAFKSNPKDQSSKHVERSYANTKLAQIWHSNALLCNNDVDCSSVCACPTWAATGIAGEQSRTFLQKYAFPTENCGPGITSTINAILRTDDELGDALNNGKSFVANSRIIEYLWGIEKLLPFAQIFGLRDFLSDMLAVVLLIGQRFTYDEFIIQRTSPESYNDQESRNIFYRWSLKAVEPWL